MIVIIIIIATNITHTLAHIHNLKLTRCESKIKSPLQNIFKFIRIELSVEAGQGDSRRVRSLILKWRIKGKEKEKEKGREKGEGKEEDKDKEMLKEKEEEKEGRG